MVDGSTEVVQVLMDRLLLIKYFESNIAAITQYENTSTSVLIIPLMHHEKLFKSIGGLTSSGNSSVDS